MDSVTIMRHARMGSMGMVATGATAVSHGLFHSPGRNQANVPFAELFPWAWATVAVLLWTAVSLAMIPRLDLYWRGLRISTLFGLTGYALTGAVATGRGIAWYIDLGGWSARSVWGVWVIVDGLVIAIFTLASRVITGEE